MLDKLNFMLKLVFVNPVYKNNDGTYVYDLFFSENPEIVWGLDWDYNNPSAISKEDILPDKTTYNDTMRIITKLPLKTIQETTCYSMEFATYGIIALSWIDIENLDEYPENGRMVFHFGEPKENIEQKLKECDILI